MFISMFTARSASIMVSVARRVVLVLFQQKQGPMNTLFRSLRCLACFFLALLHGTLMTALVLLHVLDNGRRKRENLVSRGMRLTEHASTTFINQSMHHKLRQILNKAAKSRNIYCDLAVLLSQ